MSTDRESVFNELEETMKKAISHLEQELTKIRAGKANTQMFDGLTVDYYGSPTPLNQVSNITIMDAKTISIQPWEKSMIAPIEKSILQANLGVTPQNDGNQIRIFLPPLTEERRKELVKRANGEGENAKVAIRNIRRDGIEHIKKLKGDGLSEDAAFEAEEEIQQITDRYTALIDKHLEAKDKEIMHV